MSAAAMTIPASSQLAAELWVSFASLLRSHVAMQSIARAASGLRADMSSGQQLIVSCAGKTLRVDATGVIESDERDTFFFTEDGLVEFGKAGGQPMEMEAAVEHLLDEVCR